MGYILHIYITKEKRKKYIKKEKRKVKGSALPKKYKFNFLFIFYNLKRKKTAKKLVKILGYANLC